MTLVLKFDVYILEMAWLGNGLGIHRSRGSSPPWASYLHMRASVAKQYNLVPAKGRDLFGWKVTAGLVESNGRLPPGL